MLKHLVDKLNKAKLHFLSHRGRDILQVFFVALGYDDGRDAGSPGCQYFFFETAYGHHFPPQGNLACHGHVLADFATGQQGSQGRHHGNPRRGAIFGNGTRWDVDMDIAIVIKIGRNTQLVGLGADIGQGGLGRLFHHVAEVAGQGQALFSQPCESPQ